MAVNVDIEAQVQFIAHIPACLTSGVPPIAYTGSVVQGIM